MQRSSSVRDARLVADPRASLGVARTDRKMLKALNFDGLLMPQPEPPGCSR
jgi:hypothetical protein